MKTSKGEEQIIRILRAANIRFVREKTFDDLRGGRFRFDFYLPDLHVLIEVDGMQHFKQVSKFHKTRADFTKQQEYDRRKNEYCLAKSIPLFRIPYWELDSIKTAKDIFTKAHRVMTRWHNDYLVPK